MEDDIRLYDSFIGLSKTYKNREHVEVCLYSVKTPEGKTIKNIDLVEAWLDILL